ncbi:MAG: type I secretion system permease/ATPase [Gammaproteobacteria bacterium]
MARSEHERLAASLRALKRGFLVVFAFSMAVNLLMLASPLYMLQVYDRVLTSQSLDTLVMLTFIITIALMTLAALEGVRTSLMVRLSAWLERQLGPAILSASVFGVLRHGAQPSVQGLRDIGTFRGFVTGPPLFPIMDAPWTPVYLGVIYLLHATLGWVALGGALVLFAVAVLNELSTRRLLQEGSGANIKALNQANAAVRNADAIEAMGFLPNLIRRWHGVNDQALDLQARASHRSGALVALSKFLRLSLQTAMLGGGAYFAIAGEMTPGAMIAASILAGRALAPVDQAINSWKSAVAAREAYRRIEAQLKRTPVRGEAMAMPEPEGRISVENLSFAFPGSRDALLKNLAFGIEPGEMIGLIGPSGSGKTTLCRLMLGNLVPLTGHARLDGMDLTQWEPQDRGSYLGYLPQNVELFPGTVRENIARMGEGDSELVVEAARLAGVHDMIVRMPRGYDTEIGEGGQALSGGERQRVALARALYGGPRFVILDEPNASLDKEGEASLLGVLARLKADRVTTVIISHRPGVLAHVDKVMVLQGGGIQAFGPRDEVLRQVTGASPGAEKAPGFSAVDRPRYG